MDQASKRCLIHLRRMIPRADWPPLVFSGRDPRRQMDQLQCKRKLNGWTNMKPFLISRGVLAIHSDQLAGTLSPVNSSPSRFTFSCLRALGGKNDPSCAPTLLNRPSDRCSKTLQDVGVCAVLLVVPTFLKCVFSCADHKGADTC